MGFLIDIYSEYTAGAGFAPPSFFRPDVIVACVFYEWKNPTFSSRVIPGKGGLTFRRQGRFVGAGKYLYWTFTFNWLVRWKQRKQMCSMLKAGLPNKQARGSRLL